MIHTKFFSYLSFFLAMVILIVAAAGKFIAQPDAIIFELAFVILLAISICM